MKNNSYREKKKKRDYTCHCCGEKKVFAWVCKCGFTICQDCLYENFWGMSCNGITWKCPDCGVQNNL